MKNDESRDAEETRDAVDALLRGKDTALSDPALVAARRIRGSLHPATLDPDAKKRLLGQIHGQWAWRRRRRLVRVVLAAAASIAMAVVAARMLVNPVSSLPAYQLSRETAPLIVGPFPEDQTETDRIDLIYSDRLHGFRSLELGAEVP